MCLMGDWGLVRLDEDPGMCVCVCAGIAKKLKHWLDDQNISGLIPSNATLVLFFPGVRIPPHMKIKVRFWVPTHT